MTGLVSFSHCQMLCVVPSGVSEWSALGVHHTVFPCQRVDHTQEPCPGAEKAEKINREHCADLGTQETNFPRLSDIL